jgi:kynurenine 3-monooxygenase
MYGRMIHGKHKHGDLFSESQAYDVYGQAIRASDRAGLIGDMLDALEALPNVKILFNHKLTGADFRKNLAWFELEDHAPSNDKDKRRKPEIEVPFELMIGADGAHSAVRFHLMKYTRMSYHQTYIDTLWCEFQIPPLDTSGQLDYKISPNHLHIWPGSDYMFIAIPSLDRSFTCTFFASSAIFTSLEDNPSSLLSFFQQNFPGVTPDLIDPSSLSTQFKNNPHLPLISIKCTPYTFASSAVILGDAAHAMVPFYGQGMNAGLEDVRILFEHLDAYQAPPEDTELVRKLRAKALEKYSESRHPDAVAISDLAMKNYEEMRAGVVSPVYRLRKTLEEWLSWYIPALGWRTQYSRISFGNERYSVVQEKAKHQAKVLSTVSIGAGVLGLVLVARAVQTFKLKDTGGLLARWLSFLKE